MIRIRLAAVKNFNFKWFLLKSLAVLEGVCVCVCVCTCMQAHSVVSDSL